MKKLLPAAAALLLLSTINYPLSTARAQGTAFTYQGRLNVATATATGLYDFRFKLYSDSLGSTQINVGFVTNAVPVANGLFTVALDFGATFPGAARWLEVDVKTNLASTYTVLNPLQAVTPTPYAIFANTASNLTGTLSAVQISGSVASANVSGTYGSALTLSNAANQITGAFTGNGASITNVNAATLGGFGSATFWRTNGNLGANPTNGAYLGTADNFPLEFKVGGQRVLRLEPYRNVLNGPNIIGGYSGNSVSNGVFGAFIGGGGDVLNGSNTVTGGFGSVVGGAGNTAFSFATASGDYSTASGFASTALGSISTASGSYSTALGNYTTASGNNSTAMGSSTTASGDFSTAMGYQARALHEGSFVWADSQSPPFPSTATNQFSIRAQGGVVLDDSTPAINFGSTTRQMLNLYGTTYGIGVQSSTLYQRTSSRFSWYKGGVHSDTANDPGTGGTVLMTLNTSGLTVNGTLASTSDRNAKQDFAPVDSQAVLAKVTTMPITQWKYKTDDTATRHIGPMAQDFYAAFAVGPDDKHITSVDEGGVALAAIQGLNQKIEEKDAQIKDLQTRLAKLEQLLLAKTSGEK